jgi:hypothetical protein
MSEKKTPAYGEIIERPCTWGDNDPGCHELVFAKGGRHWTGEVLFCGVMLEDGTFPEDSDGHDARWRYPGEKEWRR